jgi:hypothetical protein
MTRYFVSTPFEDSLTTIFANSLFDANQKVCAMLGKKSIPNYILIWSE